FVLINTLEAEDGKLNFESNGTAVARLVERKNEELVDNEGVESTILDLDGAELLERKGIKDSKPVLSVLVPDVTDKSLFIVLKADGTEGSLFKDGTEDAELDAAQNVELGGAEGAEPDGTEDVEPDGTEDAELDGTEDVEPDGTEDAELDGTEDVKPDGTEDAELDGTEDVE
ncbi:hypothetical protein LQ764DRAFT_228690, partial [Zygosaccharomyces rouxii]